LAILGIFCAAGYTGAGEGEKQSLVMHLALCSLRSW